MCLRGVCMPLRRPGGVNTSAAVVCRKPIKKKKKKNAQVVLFAISVNTPTIRRRRFTYKPRGGNA